MSDPWWWRQYAPLKRRSTIILHGSIGMSDHWWWMQYAPLKRRSTIILHGSIGMSDPWWWRQYAPLKRRSTIILHGGITKKTTLNIILAAVRTWNLKLCSYLATYIAPQLHRKISPPWNANIRSVKFSTLYGILMVITVFTRAHRWVLSCAEWIWFTTFHYLSIWCMLILSEICLLLPSGHII
jgi:hypothetical protein